MDPSSTRTGGSILGDKTRMIELTKHTGAYVRPSPSRGTLGGVARNTNEAIFLCESAFNVSFSIHSLVSCPFFAFPFLLMRAPGAGYNVVLIETVGVGQSEVMVADMVDMFTLLVPPAGGDELQGIKKGIVEHADLVVVNKADGELVNAARQAQIEYTSALKLLRPKAAWNPRVISVSALNSTGISDAWGVMQEFYESQSQSGALDYERRQQRKKWMWQHVVDEVTERLHSNPQVKAVVNSISDDVANGIVTPDMAAARIVDCFELSIKQGN